MLNAFGACVCFARVSWPLSTSLDMPMFSIVVKECWLLLFDHRMHRQRARVDVQLLHQALEKSWAECDGTKAGFRAHRQRVLALISQDLSPEICWRCLLSLDRGAPAHVD